MSRKNGEAYVKILLLRYHIAYFSTAFTERSIESI